MHLLYNHLCTQQAQSRTDSYLQRCVLRRRVRYLLFGNSMIVKQAALTPVTDSRLTKNGNQHFVYLANMVLFRIDNHANMQTAPFHEAYDSNLRFKEVLKRH